MDLFWRFQCLFLVGLLFGTVAVAQSNPNKTNGALIDGSKPPTYIEFIRTGTCKKDSSNFNFGHLCESKDQNVRRLNVAWLRFVNNTRWSVGLTVDKAATEKNSTSIVIPSTEFVDEDGQKAWYGKPVAKNGSEMDVVYKSEVETGCDFHMPTPKGKGCYMIEAIAPSIPLPALSSDVFVAPGETVVFPLDLAHIGKYVNIYVLYNFSWEYIGKSYAHFPHYYSQHRAYFGWFDLEKALKAERDKKTSI